MSLERRCSYSNLVIPGVSSLYAESVADFENGRIARQKLSIEGGRKTGKMGTIRVGRKLSMPNLDGEKTDGHQTFYSC